jgi:hypothetical protein
MQSILHFPASKKKQLLGQLWEYWNQTPTGDRSSWRCMLQTVQSMWANLSVYADMKPDFQLRCQINRSLTHRPTRSLDDWFETFWQPRGVTKPVARFVYQYLSDYSGLSFGRILPSDRLCEDLKLTLVCWFDWQLDLCDDVLRELGVDVSAIEFDDLETLEEFVQRLNQEYLQRRSVA